MKSLALSLAVGALACFTAIGPSQAAPVAGEPATATAKSSSIVDQVHYYHHYRHHYHRYHRYHRYHHHHM